MVSNRCGKDIRKVGGQLKLGCGWWQATRHVVNHASLIPREMAEQYQTLAPSHWSTSKNIACIPARLCYSPQPVDCGPGTCPGDVREPGSRASCPSERPGAIAGWWTRCPITYTFRPIILFLKSRQKESAYFSETCRHNCRLQSQACCSKCFLSFSRSHSLLEVS